MKLAPERATGGFCVSPARLHARVPVPVMEIVGKCLWVLVLGLILFGNPTAGLLSRLFAADATAGFTRLFWVLFLLHGVFGRMGC